MTLLVEVGVEGWWPAALGSLGSPVGVLVGFARDRRGDAPSAQVGPVGFRRVRLVGQDAVRSGPRAACEQAGNADGGQDRDELWAVAAVSGGQHDGEGFLSLLAAQVQLRGQTAAGAAEGVISRLNRDTAGWFGLQIPLFLAPAAC
ncbi:hypothetical protein FHU28_002355 [Micromonospora echinospora]|uniref:Uncharacterized protein n=1 Tax=Micromonospora echinospora TaxID=1877 RepID=A0ABR6MAW5_MICEC|nr:hypothetical protein [Micromonospora echinospora]